TDGRRVWSDAVSSNVEKFPLSSASSIAVSPVVRAITRTPKAEKSARSLYRIPQMSYQHESWPLAPMTNPSQGLFIRECLRLSNSILSFNKILLLVAFRCPTTMLLGISFFCDHSLFCFF